MGNKKGLRVCGEDKPSFTTKESRVNLFFYFFNINYSKFCGIKQES